ncbi:hypothetical protein [Glutamicibacter halophytocola]|uniref:hypothetical protein n=1 Tax=Glutamicibacter halophytocola TaxID=1933880 RepID=UPI003D2AE1FD
MQQDACTVTSAFVSADGAAVFQAAQSGQRVHDDVVAGFVFQGRNHCQTAGVLFSRWVIQPLRAGQRREAGVWRGNVLAIAWRGVHLDSGHAHERAFLWFMQDRRADPLGKEYISCKGDRPPECLIDLKRIDSAKRGMPAYRGFGDEHFPPRCGTASQVRSRG